MNREIYLAISEDDVKNIDRAIGEAESLVDSAAIVAMQAEAALRDHRSRCNVRGCRTENYLLEVADQAIEQQRGRSDVKSLLETIRTKLNEPKRERVKNMLVINRREGEAIDIGDDITIEVIRTRSNQVLIGIDAPRQKRVVRVPRSGERVALPALPVVPAQSNEVTQ
ncbi:carbon storage regulator [Neorhodopirellula pilleata]|nr:carbon storage regulator [Neorhodopirellula pilleata]